MALQKMTVCGKGTCVLTAKLPYQFYAQQGGNTPVIVNLVMPVGGKETGFYRYPKVNEMILVDTVNAEYYLMGYIPSATDMKNNFLTKEKKDDEKSNEEFNKETKVLKDEESMVLRYEQTGKNAPSATDITDRYSEIGFYRRKTQWQSTNKDYKDVTGNDSVFPHIDQINIQSTGDIHTMAKNHQQLKAKRFELLVDCKDTIHNKAKLSKDELPLGDNPGDDSVLHAGDAHIRAGKRVVIKAEEEIQLQVGRTILTINDEGFNVTSRQTCSNFPTAYDATLELQPRSGVSISGKNVQASAAHELTLTDAMGGSFSSTLGVVEVKGRELQIEAYDSVEFGLLEIGLALKLLQALVSIGLFKNEPTKTDVIGYYNLTNDFLMDVASLLKEISDAYNDGNLGEPPGSAGATVSP
ncbi:MAG: hypothetical protein LBD47_04050 [Treponema sp.]|jgi:hypothetical protein|nr:hypothetical protein [Treponema sp.]